MPIVHHDVSFAGHSPVSVGQKLMEFKQRCAAENVDCFCGVGEVSFGHRIVASYTVTLTGEREAIERVLARARQRDFRGGSGRRRRVLFARHRHRGMRLIRAAD